VHLEAGLFSEIYKGRFEDLSMFRPLADWAARSGRGRSHDAGPAKSVPLRAAKLLREMRRQGGTLATHMRVGDGR
jgi:hypothetical protein